MKLIAMLLLGLPALLPGSPPATPGNGVIQCEPLDASRPYFIPTHPRVTTTVRFPGAIQAPDGALSVFTEDAAKHAAEYLVTWQEGDTYFTVTPLKEARIANINVPFAGRTYVIYFYPVAEPLQAVAAVNLTAAAPLGAEPAATPAGDRGTAGLAITRESRLPPTEAVEVTTARLVGLLDRLKIIHATQAGPPLQMLARAMNVEVVLASAETAAARDDAREGRAGASVASGVNDFGLFQLILLRAVRDPRLNCIGFVCLLRNTSSQVLAFDVNSFVARVGAMLLPQRIADAPAILKPGEEMPAYFVVQAGRNNPVLAANEWRLTVELLSPRLHPGAALSGATGGATAP